MPETNDKEDDPSEPTPPDGQPIDRTVIAAQDAADADALLGRLMRAALPADQQEIGPDRAAVLEEVGSLIVAFNQSIQDESKDRKYRFHTLRLLKEHARTADDVDAELDFITDDDDVAFLFTDDSGKRVFAIGNVEAVAVVRGSVDRARAIGPRAATYLGPLDKDERPVKGVHLDDPKAVFLLRWYQEMDARGNILKGYQQRGCQSYYLPLDNGGYPFEWTSNLQAICPVELNPLPNKNRTYKLQPNSKKMVMEGMKKHTQ